MMWLHAKALRRKRTLLAVSLLRELMSSYSLWLMQRLSSTSWSIANKPRPQHEQPWLSFSRALFLYLSVSFSPSRSVTCKFSIRTTLPSLLKTLLYFDCFVTFCYYMHAIAPQSHQYMNMWATEKIGESCEEEIQNLHSIEKVATSNRKNRTEFAGPLAQRVRSWTLMPFSPFPFFHLRFALSHL